MLYQSMFPRELFAELSQLHRQMEQLFDPVVNIRGSGQRGFPAMNIGTTPESMELYAFVPGLEPDSIDVTVEQGMLTIAGERPGHQDGDGGQAGVHLDERFVGRFKRVISLPDDVDPETATARCRDGVLHISIKRRESAQPKRISVH